MKGFLTGLSLSGSNSMPLWAQVMLLVGAMFFVAAVIYGAINSKT